MQGERQRRLAAKEKRKEAREKELEEEQEASVYEDYKFVTTAEVRCFAKRGVP